MRKVEYIVLVTVNLSIARSMDRRYNVCITYATN